MAFGKKQGHFGGDGGGHGHGELMITPLLDLFVALIPFLILSAVMVKINVVDVAVSKPVSVIKKSQKPFNLHVKVGPTQAVLLLNKGVKARYTVDKEGVWLEKFHSDLVAIKKVNLDSMEIRVEPLSDKTSLDTLMTVMDSARRLKKSDGDIYRLDEANKEKVKLKFLFPKVILRGVYS